MKNKNKSGFKLRTWIVIAIVIVMIAAAGFILINDFNNIFSSDSDSGSDSKVSGLVVKSYSPKINPKYAHEVISSAQVDKNVKKGDLIPEQEASNIINWGQYQNLSKQELDKKAKDRGVDIKHDPQLDKLEIFYPEKIKRVEEFLEQAINENNQDDIQFLQAKIERLKDKFASVLIEKEIRKNKAFERSPIGTTYYIDFENGDDGLAGTHTSTAWKTLPKYTSTTVRSPGDIAYIRANMEHVQNTSDLYFDEDGNSTDPIYIIGCNTTFDPWNDSSNVKPNISFGGAAYNAYPYGDHFWEFRNLLFRNTSDSLGLIYNRAATSTTFRNCEFTNLAGNVYVLWDSGSFNLNFINCDFYDVSYYVFMIRGKVNIIDSRIDGASNWPIYLSGGYLNMIDTNITDHTSTSIYGEWPNDVYLRNVRFINVSNLFGGENTRFLIEDFNGTLGEHRHYLAAGKHIIKDTSVTRPGGASSSAKTVRTASVATPFTLSRESLKGDFQLWLDNSTAHKITVYIRGYSWSTFPTSDELYIETSYLDTADTPSRATKKSTQVLSDNTNWVGFKTTVAPEQTGWAYVTIYLWDDSTNGIYVDIEPVVS